MRLSGVDIILSKRYSYDNSRKNVGPRQNASLDRINNEKGYIKGNVQWLHKDVNQMKNNFKQEYFLNICRNITIFTS